MIWSEGPATGSWKPVFAEHRSANDFDDQLLATRNALLAFTAGEGTRLQRSTDGRRFTSVALPRAMAAGTLTAAYPAKGALVAVVAHGTRPGFEGAPVVWISLDGGLRWSPRAPLR